MGSEATNVRVAVRCRPLNSKESARGCGTVVAVDQTGKTIKVTGREGDAEGKNAYTYDFVYPPESSQVQVYDDIGRPFVDKAFEGFNGTIFAYGQTGSGKTHTMMGVMNDSDLRGVIPRLTDDLFGRVASEVSGEKMVQVTVSYLEIYNEVIHDLLNPQAGESLKIREHPDTGIYVERLCELVTTDSADIFRLLEQGNRLRKVATTAMNDTSSRSHSVFTLKVQQKITAVLENGNQRETELGAKLNLVDLAGSERASKTGAEGTTLKEGAAINQSLMALGGVINALSEGAPFVPYRNSKLTRLLQESLGGNAATMMVANVSPADYNTEETIGTLRYASRAKTIKNVVTRNEDVHERVIRELQEEIERLRSQLGGGGSGKALTPAQETQMEKDLEDKVALEERIQAMETAKATEWERREELTRELQEERQSNLNRQINDVMSKVKAQKLALIHAVRTLQEKRNAAAKKLHAATELYKGFKQELEVTMRDYESYQAALDRLDESDPAYERTSEELLRLLGGIERQRAKLMGVRGDVQAHKAALTDLDDKVAQHKAELQAAASTIGEHDRLRQAIQDEERRAFQSQRDKYLEEQLAEERARLEHDASAVRRRESDVLESSAVMQRQYEVSVGETAAAKRRADLLAQELALVKSEQSHAREQLAVVQGDLDHAREERAKLEEDAAITEARLRAAEDENEAERHAAVEAQEELAAAHAQTAEIEEQLRKARQEVASVRHAHAAEAKLAGSKSKAPAAGGGPAVAEAKALEDGAARAKALEDDALRADADVLRADLARALRDRDVADRDRADLEQALREGEEARVQMAAQAKDNEFAIFKSVMDAAATERARAQADFARLQHLLQQAARDIVYLTKLNSDYKRELDIQSRFEDG
ncbi:P-loop containing nucleoside triphosphate hydrolase protein [Pelagophyceae sp. CCMP2097]|nr:P-loop containing nucleoside triphosphate hydrolase protein [Pelagophyceae sp. CCMP2097]